MVVLPHCPSDVLNAYSTTPITPFMNHTLQHGIYDGTSARYGNPMYTVTLHDRPDFIGKSHYDVRIALDSQGMTDGFIVIDEQTPSLDAVWWVDDTEDCKANDNPDFYPAGDAPVRYPGEDFTLWQAHMRTSDVASNVASWDVGCSDIQEAISGTPNWPYDPHSSQPYVLDFDIDWKDPEVQAHYWGVVYIRADADEVEWSSNSSFTKTHVPLGKVMVRLKKEVATSVGLLQVWSQQDMVVLPPHDVNLIASYDWESPIWPTGYPDERTKRSALNLPALGNGTRSITSTTACGVQHRSILRKGSCAGARLKPAGSQGAFASIRT